MGWRGASPVGAAALSQIIQGPISQCIESPRSDIFLNLAVPGGRVQLGEPRPKCGEFLRGKPAKSILNLFKCTHETELTPPHKPKTGYTDFMTITIEIPDELVAQLVRGGQEPARAVVEEAIALDGYRNDRLTEAISANCSVSKRVWKYTGF